MAVTIDFVAFDDERDACLLVLVEQGPWRGPLEEHLRTLQGKLYDYLEAALDGSVAARFPKAANKKVIVRLDCYDLPTDEVDGFMKDFADGIRGLPDYSASSSPWVRSFEFEVNHDHIH